MNSDKLFVIFYIYVIEREDEEIKSSEKDIHSEQTEEHDKRKSWKDVLNKPSRWQVVHSTKVFEFSPLFVLYLLFCPSLFGNKGTSFIFVF